MKVVLSIQFCFLNAVIAALAIQLVATPALAAIVTNNYDTAPAFTLGTTLSITTAASNNTLYSNNFGYLVADSSFRIGAGVNNNLFWKFTRASGDLNDYTVNFSVSTYTETSDQPLAMVWGSDAYGLNDIPANSSLYVGLLSNITTGGSAAAYLYNGTIGFTPVPEPRSLSYALVMLGLTGLICYCSRRPKTLARITKLSLR